MQFKTLYVCTIERKKMPKDIGQCRQEPATNKCGGKRKGGKRGGRLVTPKPIAIG